MCVLLLLGCDGATQLLVIVDSDIAGLHSVEATASSGSLHSSRRFEVATSGLPFSFGVVRADGAAEDVRISVSGLIGDDSVVGYSVQTRFIAGRTLRVEAPLAAACQGEPGCGDTGMRCVYGACMDEVVDPGTLPQGDAPPNALFDGPPPPVDASVPGFDAGEAGCVPDAPCANPLNPCEVGAWVCDSDAPSCDVTDTLGEGEPCGMGRTCDGMGRCGAMR